MRISWYETRKWPTKHFGYHPQLLGIYFPYGYTTDTDISSLQRIHNLKNRKQRRQEYTWKVLFYIFSLSIIFFPFWSVIMYVLKIQIVSCALHTLPIPSNFERKHDNCQKVMAAVWRVYNFLFIEKKNIRRIFIDLLKNSSKVSSIARGWRRPCLYRKK